MKELTFKQFGLGVDGSRNELLALSENGKLWYWSEMSNRWRRFCMLTDDTTEGDD